jgi:dephospho-CoA kinase
MESFGVVVFYADSEGKRILQSDPTAIAEVVREFGPESYDDDGLLNRALIASIVFNDADRLAKLNEIVHPRVRTSFNEFVHDHIDSKLVVHESAIIFEAGLSKNFDAIVVVEATLERRLDWALTDGKSEDSFRSRMSQQMEEEELRQLADYIIFNNGSIGDLEDEVELLLRSLLFLPKKHGQS